MICARCGIDSRRKDRTSGRCPNCGGQFAFMQGRTDPVSEEMSDQPVSRFALG